MIRFYRRLGSINQFEVDRFRIEGTNNQILDNYSFYRIKIFHQFYRKIIRNIFKQ